MKPLLIALALSFRLSGESTPAPVTAPAPPGDTLGGALSFIKDLDSVPILVESALRPFTMIIPLAPAAKAQLRGEPGSADWDWIFMREAEHTMIFEDPVLGIERSLLSALREHRPGLVVDRQTLVSPPGRLPGLPSWVEHGRPFLHLNVSQWSLQHGAVLRAVPRYRLNFNAQLWVRRWNGTRLETLGAASCTLSLRAGGKMTFQLEGYEPLPWAEWAESEGARIREHLSRSADLCGRVLAANARIGGRPAIVFDMVR